VRELVSKKKEKGRACGNSSEGRVFEVKEHLQRLEMRGGHRQAGRAWERMGGGRSGTWVIRRKYCMSCEEE
jgi:hypothetical protein